VSIYKYADVLRVTNLCHYVAESASNLIADRFKCLRCFKRRKSRFYRFVA